MGPETTEREQSERNERNQRREGSAMRSGYVVQDMKEPVDIKFFLYEQVCVSACVRAHAGHKPTSINSSNMHFETWQQETL